MNNGWASEFSSLGRGVRQRYLSPHIFILCAKILASAIRNDENINGLSIDGVKSRISQYADDATLILNGTKGSIESSLTMLAHSIKLLV